MEQQAEQGPVRIGFVGVGGHGRTLLEATARARNLKIVGVYDPNREAADASAALFDGPVYDSFEALLAGEDLEAVVLATPNHLHRRQAEAALAAGKHVLVEKPIAVTIEDGRAMVEAADRAGRVLMVGHNMRRGRAARLARRYLDERRLGQIITMECHFSSGRGRSLEAGDWRLRPEFRPVLPLLQLGIHAVDLVHYLIGPIQSVTGFARSAATASDVADSVVAGFQTKDGLLGTIVSNYCTQTAFDYRIAGTEGTLYCTPHTVHFHRSGEPEGLVGRQDFRAHAQESFVLQLEAFAEAIRTGGPPETDGRTGLRALAVVEAVRHAVASGKTEPVCEIA